MKAKGGGKGGGKSGNGWGKGGYRKGLNSLEGEHGGGGDDQEWPVDAWEEGAPHSWTLNSLTKKVSAVRTCQPCLAGTSVTETGVPPCPLKKRLVWANRTRFEVLGENEENDDEQEEPEVSEPGVISEESKDEKQKPKRMPRMPRKKKNYQKSLSPLMRNDGQQRGDGPSAQGNRPLYALKPKYQGFKPVQVVVDSAAVDCVMARTTINEIRSNPDAPLKQGEAAKAGVSYVAADGGEIPNEGEQLVDMMTKEGHECDMTWQVADIQKPLLSVRALTKSGHQVNFRQNDGEIVNNATGRKIHFVRRGDLYVVTMWMRAREESSEPGFRRQGKK